MTAQICHFPASPLMEARAELVATSRAVLRSPEPQAEQDIRNACLYLQTWGRPEYDYITAHHALAALEMRRAERAEAMRRDTRGETPMDVVMQHRGQWPLIAAYGLAGAAMLLAATGWL